MSAQLDAGTEWGPQRGRAGSPAEHLGWGAIRAGVLESTFPTCEIAHETL